ncbi:kinase-like domain-containing protein [Rhizophagus irregularis DAOM 181602=DAOM 197198]|nr:kinase-like domain-containing protein [Rhizophagus irregularis DAOM 181602=DAOM 197198]
MNELFKWIDEAIAKKHIKHYEYKYFKNIQEIGIDQEIKVTALRNYLLVMEYADGCSLNNYFNYLKENFENLT